MNKENEKSNRMHKSVQINKVSFHVKTLALKYLEKNANVYDIRTRRFVLENVV